MDSISNTWRRASPCKFMTPEPLRQAIVVARQKGAAKQVKLQLYIQTYHGTTSFLFRSNWKIYKHWLTYFQKSTVPIILTNRSFGFQLAVIVPLPQASAYSFKLNQQVIMSFIYEVMLRRLISRGQEPNILSECAV